LAADDDVDDAAGSRQQSMAVSSQPPAVQSSTPQLMTQNDRLSPPQATNTA